MNITVVREKVAEQLASCGDVVAERVIGVLAGREIEKRGDAVLKALEDLAKLEGEVQKLSKYDVQTFDESGNVVSEGFSKQRKEAREKNAKDIARLSRAVEDAFGKNEWKALCK